MEALYNILNWIDGNILWGIPMIILILVCGILLSLKSKFLQVRKFKSSIGSTIGETFKKKDKNSFKNKNTVSPFEAFATAVSGTVGTGNIVGVTTAIISGGPGAVFWMWISAFFGMVTKFSEITLGVYFRKKSSDGEYIGGPMYYIEQGTGKRWLAILFAIFTMFAALGMGSVQANTIQSTWNTAFHVPTWLTAIIIAFLTAIVVIGGIKRIGKVTSLLVPFMIVIFLIMSLTLIFANVAAVPKAFASIFTSAFSTKSLLGGISGYGIARAMRYGFARGIFSNEAGLGSSSIAHSNSSEREPVKQGLWGIFEVFIDTFVICTLTALLILTSGIDLTPTPDLNGANVAMSAFTKVFGVFGTVMYSIILPLFAFSTILAWAIYGAKAMQYVFKKHQKGSKLAFNVLYITFIVGIAFLTYFFGDNLGADFVWLISDMTNALMAIPNLIALIILSGLLIKIVNNYFKRKKDESIPPLISAYDDEGNFIKR